jgi:hypothetical protein
MLVKDSKKFINNFLVSIFFEKRSKEQMIRETSKMWKCFSMYLAKGYFLKIFLKN